MITRQVADAAATLADALSRGGSIVALTGAGISAESGVPTFRGGATDEPGAVLWSKYDPVQLATPEAFEADPGLVSRWYEWRLSLLARCVPNDGHRALADLEQRTTAKGGSFLLATQNVDGLHAAAGSKNLHELHGSIAEWRCTRCGAAAGRPSLPFSTAPLRCRDDGAPLRPGVVWFGEALPAEAFGRATDAAGACDVLLAVGTSAVVYPAAGLIDIALAAGALVIEINPEPTPYSSVVSHSLRGSAGSLLPTILASC